MEDAIVSVRIDRKVYERMRRMSDVNWSSILRKAISKYLEGMDSIDVERAESAVRAMDEVRASGVFDKGRSGTKLIREWREKRR